MSMRVGFVGVGTMGAEMALSVVRGGFPLTVYDVSRPAMQRLAEQGAALAESPAEVAERSDMVSVVVLNDEQTVEVVQGRGGILEGARPGMVIAVHSTVHFDTIVQLEEAVTRRGVSLLDVPVSGGPHSAAGGALAVMVGGPAEVFERCRPVLETYGGLVVRMGDVGQGTVTKLARNLVGFAWCAAAYEGMRIMEESGLDLETFRRIYEYTEHHARLVSRYLERPTTAPADPEERPDWIRLANYLLPKADKDLDAAIEYGKRLGIHLPVAEACRAELPATWSNPGWRRS